MIHVIEAAQMLGVTREHVYRLINQGKITKTKRGHVSFASVETLKQAKEAGEAEVITISRKDWETLHLDLDAAKEEIRKLEKELKQYQDLYVKQLDDISELIGQLVIANRKLRDLGHKPVGIYV